MKPIKIILSENTQISKKISKKFNEDIDFGKNTQKTVQKSITDLDDDELENLGVDPRTFDIDDEPKQQSDIRTTTSKSSNTRRDSSRNMGNK